jgi:TonB family protein
MSGLRNTILVPRFERARKVAMKKSYGVILCVGVLGVLPAIPQSHPVSPTPRYCSTKLNTGPQYPNSLRGSGIQGAVLIDAVVGENGCVQSVTVVRKLHPTLDDLATQTVRSWKFTPAKKDGKSVRVRVELSVEFKESN